MFLVTLITYLEHHESQAVVLRVWLPSLSCGRPQVSMTTRGRRQTPQGPPLRTPERQEGKLLKQNR